jgi:hypothetical protein
MLAMIPGFRDMKVKKQFDGYKTAAIKVPSETSH